MLRSAAETSPAGGGGRSRYQVELPVFTGPLDLLLQLVEKERVSIYDIPIARITEQYLKSLEEMREMDLDVASDFLVLAATLMYIKARELLPRPVGEPGGEGDPDAYGEEGLGEGDPRRELIRRLVEYKEIKQYAAHLADLQATAAGLYTRGRVEAAVPASSRSAAVTTGSDGSDGVDRSGSIADLWRSYKAVMARVSAGPGPYVAGGETFSVLKKMGQILGRLWREGVVSFDRLVSGKASRSLVVVTLLAILELFRRGRVWIEQDALFGRVQVGLRSRRGGGKT